MIDYAIANTNTKIKYDWRRKACVIDLRSIQKEDQKNILKRRKVFFFGWVVFALIASSTLIANAASVKTSTTVEGWYEINQSTNERLDLTTNMTVYVNGEKYVGQGVYSGDF